MLAGNDKYKTTSNKQMITFYVTNLVLIIIQYSSYCSYFKDLQPVNVNAYNTIPYESDRTQYN